MSYSELRKGRVSLPNQTYFITVTTNDRTSYFSNFNLGRIVVEEMRRLHEDKDVASMAWVVMPDHVHWLFQLEEQKDLPNVMKQLKARSAKRINETLRKKGAVWQRAYYDHAVRKDEDIREIARYIIANPLRKKLVSEIGKYPLWDAIWLAQDSLI